MSSSARTVPAELGTGSDEKAKHHHSLAKLKEELASKDAYIAELEVAREQQLSAKPSAAQDIQTASVRQLIDALVALAKQKTDDEIMQMVDQVCGRLNRLKRKDVEAGAVQDARPGVARR